jgi:hypothetical protein
VCVWRECVWSECVWSECVWTCVWTCATNLLVELVLLLHDANSCRATSADSVNNSTSSRRSVAPRCTCKSESSNLVTRRCTATRATATANSTLCTWELASRTSTRLPHTAQQRLATRCCTTRQRTWKQQSSKPLDSNASLHRPPTTHNHTRAQVCERHSKDDLPHAALGLEQDDKGLFQIP